MRGRERERAGAKGGAKCNRNCAFFTAFESKLTVFDGNVVFVDAAFSVIEYFSINFETKSEGGAVFSTFYSEMVLSDLR